MNFTSIKDRMSVFLKNKSVNNAGWIIGAKAVQVPISIVVNAVVTRHLGDAGTGIISYAGAYTAFFASLCTLGINSVLVKEFVDGDEDEGTVLGTSLFLRALSSLLSALTIIGICLFLDAGEPERILVVSLCTVGMFFQIFELFNFRFQSMLKSKVSSIATMIAYFVTALYKLILVFMKKGVVWFGFSTAVDYICIAVILYFAYKKYDGKPLRISFSYAKKLLSKSCHFILPGLMVSVYGQTDKIMLTQMIGDSENGFYSTAIGLCNMWVFVLVAIIDSMYPVIMKSYRENDGKFVKYNKLLYAIIFYVSTFVSLMFVLLADFIIMILYGEAFAPTAAPLRVITWYTAFAYLGVARDAWIVCKNRQKYIIWMYIGAAVSNVILNFILIPIWGSVGAAVASLCAQLVTLFVIPMFIPAMRENAIMILEAITLKGVLWGKNNKS